jgi:hypothetical protein
MFDVGLGISDCGLPRSANPQSAIPNPTSNLPVNKLEYPEHDSADNDAKAECPVIAGFPNKKTGKKPARHQEVVRDFESDGNERHEGEQGANGDGYGLFHG